jgi:hypothetical protein
MSIMADNQWDYGVVAFIDILGFSAFVEEDSARQVPEHLVRLMSSLEKVKASAGSGALDFRSFSDSIIISSSLSLQTTADLFSSAVRLQRVFSHEGVLVRGAIAFGKHFANTASMYSEALVRAYVLERNEARFPRILVDRNLLDWFFNHQELSAELGGSTMPLLMKDRDGGIFLNYLEGPMLEKHGTLVRSYDVARVSASVLEKLQWLAAYHNHVAGMIDIGAKVSDSIVGGFEAFTGAV